MADYRDLLNDGARRREEALAQVREDLQQVEPPDDPLMRIAYWDCLREELGNRVQEAVAIARVEGHQWAEIAGALNTSTESARGRHQYYKDNR